MGGTPPPRQSRVFGGPPPLMRFCSHLVSRVVNSKSSCRACEGRAHFTRALHTRPRSRSNRPGFKPNRHVYNTARYALVQAILTTCQILARVYARVFSNLPNRVIFRVFSRFLCFSASLLATQSRIRFCRRAWQNRAHNHPNNTPNLLHHTNQWHILIK